MAQLQSTNITGTLCVNGVAVGGGKDFKFCCFTSTTNFTPSSDLVSGDGVIQTLLVGGGGEAGTVNTCRVSNYNNTTLAGGGGGGEVREFMYEVTASEAHSITVGAGGCTTEYTWSPGANCTLTGATGGTTSINGKALCEASGGGGGGGCAIRGMGSPNVVNAPGALNGGEKSQRGGGMMNANACGPVSEQSGYWCGQDSFGYRCQGGWCQRAINHDYSGSLFAKPTSFPTDTYARGYATLGSIFGAGGGSRCSCTDTPAGVSRDGAFTGYGSCKGPQAECCGTGGSPVCIYRDSADPCAVSGQGGAGGNGLVVIQWNE